MKEVVAAGPCGGDWAVDGIVDEADEKTCALHFTSSVGVETTQVARPPKAPAMNVVVNDGCICSWP